MLQKSLITILSAVTMLLGNVSVFAGDELPAPPYLVTNTRHVLIGVTWDKTVVEKLLPSGVEPVADMSGVINIYQADGGYGISPYSAVYFSVDLEGMDSPSGAKARWILQGVYGPENHVSEALRTFYGLPVRNGSALLETTDNSTRATGFLNDQPFITVEVQSKPESCQSASGMNYYPGLIEHTRQLVNNPLPWTGEFCQAELVSIDVSAQPDDPIAALQPDKVLWVGELKNGTFTFSYPIPVP